MHFGMYQTTSIFIVLIAVLSKLDTINSTEPTPVTGNSCPAAVWTDIVLEFQTFGAGRLVADNSFQFPDTIKLSSNNCFGFKYQILLVFDI